MNDSHTTMQRESSKPAHADLFPRIRSLMDVKTNKEHLLSTAGPDFEEYMAFHAVQSMYHWMGHRANIKSMQRLRELNVVNKALEPVSH